MFYYQTFFLLQIRSLLHCSKQIPEKIRGFAIERSLREISYVLYAHAPRVRALMTRENRAQ